MGRCPCDVRDPRGPRPDPALPSSVLHALDPVTPDPPRPRPWPRRQEASLRPTGSALNPLHRASLDRVGDQGPPSHRDPSAEALVPCSDTCKSAAATAQEPSGGRCRCLIRAQVLVSEESLAASETNRAFTSGFVVVLSLLREGSYLSFAQADYKGICVVLPRFSS